MSQLRHGIARAFEDHRSGSGRQYVAVCKPIADRFGGTVPPDARQLLKAYGRLALDIDRVHGELEHALTRRRMKDVRRYRRQLAGMNRDLLAFTARLEEQAAAVRKARPIADYFANLKQETDR